jgi:hypothetical protein
MKKDDGFSKFYINIDIYENHTATDDKNDYTYILFELKR